MIKYLKNKFSSNAREKRAQLFCQKLKPQGYDNILDLGGGDGSHINRIIKNCKSANVNITISDISKEALEHAKKEYGYDTLIIDESSALPFADNAYDIVFCNSVIEHTTIPKKDIWTFKNTKQFRKESLRRQSVFADEIRRISKAYFVQTPYRYFIIESHSWLPGIIVLLPRWLQINIIKFFNKFWPKQTSPDWNLLTYKDMERLFPDARIYKEKSLGLTKSLIAIKTK